MSATERSVNVAPVSSGQGSQTDSAGAQCGDVANLHGFDAEAAKRPRETPIEPEMSPASNGQELAPPVSHERKLKLSLTTHNVASEVSTRETSTTEMPPTSKRRVDGEGGSVPDSRPVQTFTMATFPSAPTAVAAGVPSGVQQPNALPSPSSSPSVVSPPGRIPTKIPRKTPVSTPTSSVTTTPVTLCSPPSSAGGSFSSVPATADPKVAARIGRWADMLFPEMMKERQSHEEEAIRELCRRIGGAIRGDKQEARDTFLMLYVNLKDPKNGELRRRVIEGELLVESLVVLGEHDLVNPERRKALDEGFEERAKDTNLVEIRKASMTSSALFPCPKCKAKDCTWTQKQTRSADEPMTVFCTCNKCGNVWKRF